MLDKEDIRKEWEQGLLIVPSTNIFETDDDFIMKINMPGVEKEGVEIKLADEELIIYGRIIHDFEDADRFVLKEIEDGNYYRVFRVTDSIDVDTIKAEMADGVLTVRLPKHERIKPREIPIELSNCRCIHLRTSLTRSTSS